MSLLFISDSNRKFGQNERVEFTIIKEKDGFRAVADNDIFEIKTMGFNELIRWLLDNIPNYRSNENKFGDMRNQL